MSLDRILSGDRPRSRVLAVLLVAGFLALLGAPFLFPVTTALGVAERICIFIVLAASYDIVLGYTSIVSFAHAMFFGIGAYGVAIPLTALPVGPDWRGGRTGGIGCAGHGDRLYQPAPARTVFLHDDPGAGQLRADHGNTTAT